MPTDPSTPRRRLGLTRMPAWSFWLGLALTTSNLTLAQTAPAPLTREQVKMERDEFLKTHRYDNLADNWVMKPEFEAPAGVKTREQVKAERNEFLRHNRYDETTSSWVPLKGSVAPVSTKSRAQVREETRQFMRTHRWNEAKEVWEEFKPVTKKAKP